jgi:phosphate-selective porin OprO/OprP
MRTHIAAVLAFASLFVGAAASRAGTELGASWDNGIVLQSEDKAFKVRIGGRLQNDWAWFDQTDGNKTWFGDIPDGTELRRARLSVSGTVYTYILFKAEYDFAGAAEKAQDGKASKEVAVKDAYIGVTGIPFVGTVQVGHQKEPFGLEVLTSDDYTTFMERSCLVLGSYLSDRNTGFRQQNAYFANRVTLSSGFFRDTDNGGRDSRDGGCYAGTVRVTGLPWRGGDDGGLFHLGAAYSYRNTDVVKIESKPSAHLALSSLTVGTGNITTDAAQFCEAEGALVWGPFSAQGEYTISALDSDESGDPSFQAYYVYGSAFLTGESRAYRAAEGIFDRVKPKRNFRQDGSGVGALDLGVRYEIVDLNDKDIYGGKLTDITVGVNWYLNPNTRVMVNYVNSSVDGWTAEEEDLGTLSTLQTRFQIDF